MGIHKISHGNPARSSAGKAPTWSIYVTHWPERLYLKIWFKRPHFRQTHKKPGRNWRKNWLATTESPQKKNGGWNFLNGDALVAVEFSNLWNDGAVHRGCACDPVRSIWASHHHLLQSQTKQSCISTMASTYEFPENPSKTRRVTTNTIATTSHWLLLLFVTIKEFQQTLYDVCRKKNTGVRFSPRFAQLERLQRQLGDTACINWRSSYSMVQLRMGNGLLSKLSKILVTRHPWIYPEEWSNQQCGALQI